MDGATLRKAFDPFFTTKAPGHGTGLGLAMIHGIITQAGGHCQLYSELGHGTTFSALLPASDLTITAPPDPARRTRGGTETILVVEDESAIRDVAFRILTGHGYRVLVAGDAHRAIEVAEGEAQGIDLVVTDLLMPGLSGRELTEILLASRPELKVLFMSGYAKDVLGAPPGGFEITEEILAKPFSSDRLLRAVRDTLDR
jgi:CheY-like chemotaxis protein